MAIRTKWNAELARERPALTWHAATQPADQRRRDGMSAAVRASVTSQQVFDRGADALVLAHMLRRPRGAPRRATHREP
jgi:hypothetical protein